MEKVYLIKNGVVVHTSNPNLFLADGWTHKHNNPEAKKPALSADISACLLHDISLRTLDGGKLTF